MLLNKYGQILLENLLKSGYALDQRNFLNTFTVRDRNYMLDAISRLESDLMVTRDFSEDGITIILPDNKKTEALRFVSAIKLDDYSYSPIEELIPKKYSAPFLIKKGEKKIHGKVSTYAFCHTYKDPFDVICFVINAKQDNIYPIHLGSVFNPSSKISQFLKEIDSKFAHVLFTREDLKTQLPKKLIQNNQPTKAAVEYLCHTNFLIRLDYPNTWSKFERTGKPHPITVIDEIIELHKPTVSATMTFQGGQYACTEENGFYPVLL